VNVKLFHHDVI